ncbi:hypothetical protein PRZ48_011897 [Zasmidium cellare]|uniref:F-box domain-containing protein n=1 Tax=Zasmidium cellare TaxID=395010 RepID=A0ABR0E7P0_ZASCE|nr:hypothetical protein PRZ48_011897 [Zasmidium cellare]
MATLLKPHPLDEMVTTFEKKPKGLLDLPQELRDHIFSLAVGNSSLAIPFSHLSLHFHDRALSHLATISRTLRHDIYPIFCAQIDFTLLSSALTNPKRSWTEQDLSHVQCLYVFAEKLFRVGGGQWQDAPLKICKGEDGFWVRLTCHEDVYGARDEFHVHTKKCCARYPEELGWKLQPYVEKLEEMINAKGCITVEAIKMIDEIREVFPEPSLSRRVLWQRSLWRGVDL